MKPYYIFAIDGKTVTSYEKPSCETVKGGYVFVNKDGAIKIVTPETPKEEPDIEMECLAQISFTPQSITDAISVLRHELLQHGEIYRGFKASLKTAIEKYCTCGLPFEPEAETAGKILDFMIGEEHKE